MNHSIAIVAIARLENPYINEWIEYHRNLGFSHFYIYDNSYGDEIHIDKVLTDDNAKYTTVIPIYNKYAWQKHAYEDAYGKYGGMHEYLLYIDIDEFFTLCSHKSVSEYIDFLNSKCPGFQSCRLHWEIYDDNNAIERDISIPITQFFTQKAKTKKALEANNQTKSIIKCGIPGMYFPSVHYAKSSKKPLLTCNSIGEKINSSSGIIIKERYVGMAKIRHYMTKTISEYMAQKLCRGDAAGYIVRDINNKFFNYCECTQEKLDYYNQHKHLIGGVDKELEYWYWQESKPNAGDVFNKYLVEKLYACKTRKSEIGESPDVVFCGSILLSERIRNTKYVCGCGLQRIDNTKSPPSNAIWHAVRGEITKNKLREDFSIELGDDVLLCDPGLLLSRLYHPSKPIVKKYKIGIIPHYVDEYKVRRMYGGEFHIISMVTSDIEKLADDILSCDLIVSSSLHGIIFSHSLGVPAYHYQLTDLMKNGNFKFNDYYSSFDGLVYHKFMCGTNGRIPLTEILDYDKQNRAISNPSVEQVVEKQKKFLEILPYRENVKKNMEEWGIQGFSLGVMSRRKNRTMFR